MPLKSSSLGCNTSGISMSGDARLAPGLLSDFHFDIMVVLGIRKM